MTLNGIVLRPGELRPFLCAHPVGSMYLTFPHLIRSPGGKPCTSQHSSTRSPVFPLTWPSGGSPGASSFSSQAGRELTMNRRDLHPTWWLGQVGGACTGGAGRAVTRRRRLFPTPSLNPRGGGGKPVHCGCLFVPLPVFCSLSSFLLIVDMLLPHLLIATYDFPKYPGYLLKKKKSP